MCDEDQDLTVSTEKRYNKQPSYVKTGVNSRATQNREQQPGHWRNPRVPSRALRSSHPHFSRKTEHLLRTLSSFYLLLTVQLQSFEKHYGKAAGKTRETSVEYFSFLNLFTLMTEAFCPALLSTSFHSSSSPRIIYLTEKGKSK